MYNMSDSDNDSMFDRLAASKYAAQADLSDDDSAFIRAPKKRESVKKSSAKVKPEIESQEIDSDLENLANEVSAIDTERIAKIQEEIKKWEAVRAKARTQKVDANRIAKVDKKIKELQAELSSLTVTTHAQDQEIQRLEREIAALESERMALTQKIDAKTARLRQLKPQEDWLNDPSQLGGRVVDGKFVEDDDDEDDYTQLASMMAERRRAAQASGQYNAESGHVRIKNPEPTRDTNVGF
jgi:chromosome segregation ATPase